MAGTGVDLSAFKPVAGQPLAAAPIANAMTALEAYTAALLDPASLLQKAATAGQVMQWNGTLWAPGPALAAPTFVSNGIAAAGSISVTANQAYLFPIPLSAVMTVTRIGYNVASASGNLDAGIYYSDDEATFTRLVSKGSTTQGGSSSGVTVASTTLTPVTGRRWYLALAADNATGAFYGSVRPCMGAYTKATSFPLPASITGASVFATSGLMMGAMI